MQALRKSSAMLSPSDERYSLAPKGSRDAGNATSKAAGLGTRTRYRTPPSNPPSHPTATTEVGQLLDLGLALGHQRFELVSLAGRDNAGMVAAHAWAEVRDCSDSTGVDPRAMPASRARSRRRPPPPPPASEDDDVRFQAGHQQDALKEVEWLRERVDNLSQELVLARRDSGRLAKQLKQEEGVGREQRRRADCAVREVKALREELDRLKDARTVKEAASRAVLSDAHSRSVRMAERRRRQQAESLMQAYKGLYEDQLQTQHASAESYRSLTRGYSRLSADNKALRQQTAAVTGGVASTATFSPSSDEQPGARPFARTATQTNSLRSDRSHEPQLLRAPMHGGEIEVAPEGASDDLARSSTDAVPLSGMVGDGDGDVRGRDLAAPGEAPADAVATAAAAVAAAAGALAKAAVSTESATTHQPSHRAHGAELSEGMAPPEKHRSGTDTTDCASTVETFSCSPFSDTEIGSGEQRGVGDTAPASTRERPAGPSSASALRKQECSAGGDDRGDSRSCCPSVEAYAFPTGGGPSTSTQQRQDARSGGGDGKFGGNSGDFSARKFGVVAAAVAVPPVEPPPRWRGRSVGSGRLVASSASWTEAVDGPKRSSSPPPPTRGRWGQGGGGGGGSGWGGTTAVSGQDGCTRIEPSRTRPHSI
ncbi:unnamed protein product [Laminaria digitata]